jgi:hypothetical protein
MILNINIKKLKKVHVLFQQNINNLKKKIFTKWKEKIQPN